jgi:thiamine pyrophosphokinase
LVLAGGDPVDPSLASRLPPAGLVVAADAGLSQAETLGLTVDLVVGDMDSVDPVALEEATEAGTAVERHPPDKDATDLELAVHAARDRGAVRIIVLGGYGGRLDHFLGNALLLGSSDLDDIVIEWWVRGNRIVAIRGEATFDGQPGDLLTLLAVGGPAAAVFTEGLRWALDGEDLLPGSTRGVSNELTGTAASVTVGSGVVLAIHEGVPS